MLSFGATPKHGWTSIEQLIPAKATSQARIVFPSGHRHEYILCQDKEATTSLIYPRRVFLVRRYLWQGHEPLSASGDQAEICNHTFMLFSCGSRSHTMLNITLSKEMSFHFNHILIDNGGESLTTMTVIRIDIPSKANLPDMWKTFNLTSHFHLRENIKMTLSVAWWALRMMTLTMLWLRQRNREVGNRHDDSNSLPISISLDSDSWIGPSSIGGIIVQVFSRKWGVVPIFLMLGRTAKGAHAHEEEVRFYAQEKDHVCITLKSLCLWFSLGSIQSRILFRVIQSPDDTFDQRDFSIIDDTTTLSVLHGIDGSYHQPCRFHKSLYTIPVPNALSPDWLEGRH